MTPGAVRAAGLGHQQRAALRPPHAERIWQTPTRPGAGAPRCGHSTSDRSARGGVASYRSGVPQPAWTRADLRACSRTVSARMTVDGLADCGWSPRQVRSQADQAERVSFLVRRQPGCLTARPSCAGRSRRPAAVRAAGSPVRSRPHRPHSAGAHSMVSSGSSDSPDVLPGAPGCLPGFRPVFSRSDRSVLFFAYGLPVTAASTSSRSRGPACAPAERSGPPARQSSPPARRSPYPWLPARGDEPRPSPPCPRAARRSTARPPPAAPAASGIRQTRRRRHAP